MASSQGSQFTSEAFTGRLEAADVAINMDGRGRAIDNVFVERLWRTVKYEEIYLKDYASAWEVETEHGMRILRHKRGNPDIELCRSLPHRATSRLYPRKV